MKDELISKQILKDEIEHNLDFTRIDNTNNKYVRVDMLLEMIDTQPTAYDVDKVSYYLEQFAIQHDKIALGLSNIEERHTQLKVADTYRQAKMIVKAGDKDEIH